MWLDRLKELRKEAGNPSYKHIAVDADMPERTVSRIFSGETESPTIDNLLKIVNVLGGTPDDIFADTKAVVSRVTLLELQTENERLTLELDKLNSELTFANAEKAVLEERAATLTKENEILRLKLEHKEEIIALHNYYAKLKNE